MSDTEDRPRYPIEHRNATLAGVNFAKRIIDVIAVPWEEETVVMHRGEVVREIIQRGAFDGLEKRPGRVRVNRDHDEQRTCGKLLSVRSAPEGMVAELRIAQTPLGDETLQLADEECLAPSVAFAAGGAGQRMIRNAGPPVQYGGLLERLPEETRNRLPVRRVIKAFLDHVAMVPDQAYQGARVLAVRSTIDTQHLPELPPAVLTPSLDEWSRYLEARRVKVRV